MKNIFMVVTNLPTIMRLAISLRYKDYITSMSIIFVSLAFIIQHGIFISLSQFTYF